MTTTKTDTKKRIAPIAIRFPDGEGRLESYPREVVAPNADPDSIWHKAQSELSTLAVLDEAPRREDGGYLKVNFEVEFPGDFTYSGRFDLRRDGRGDSEDETLRVHIRRHLEFMAGLFQPSHMSDEAYEAMQTDYELGGYAAQAREILNKYHI